MTHTIKDVAKWSRVSVGTVSNVLNCRPTVKPAVRARVEAAIEELKYRPNRRAQNFARDSTPVLSFVMSNRDLFDPFHCRVLEGVCAQCEESGFFVLFSKFQYRSDVTPQKLRLPDAIVAHGIADCVILSGVNYPNLLGALSELAVPNVVFANNLVGGRPNKPVDQVRFDDIGAAKDATKYLIEMGHRAIWYVGDVSQQWFRNRYMGYLSAMAEYGLDPMAHTAGISDDRFINGFRCTESIVRSGQPLTAIFAGTDEVAYGCWEYLQQHSICVPEQISIVGFDDQRGPYKGLGLTTVRVEAETIGRELAKMAIEKIGAPSKDIEELIVSTKLMKRGTCQPPGGASQTLDLLQPK